MTGPAQPGEPLPADAAGVEFGEPEHVDEAAGLNALEWTCGGEPLPVPANDTGGEPEWLFEGHKAAGSPADPSGAGRGGRKSAETADGTDLEDDAAGGRAGDGTLDWQ